MAEQKVYNLAQLDRSQVSYIRKLAKDGLAKVTLTVEHMEINIDDKVKPRKSK